MRENNDQVMNSSNKQTTFEKKKKKKSIKMVGGVNEKQACARSEVKSQRSV